MSRESHPSHGLTAVLLAQVERAQDVGSGAAVPGGRARRPQPVCAGAAAVHADARGELLLGRGRAARLRRLRRHGLRGYHAFGRGAGEPAAAGEQLDGEGASAAASLMSEQRADCVPSAATVSDGQRESERERERPDPTPLDPNRLAIPSNPSLFQF